MRCVVRDKRGQKFSLSISRNSFCQVEIEFQTNSPGRIHQKAARKKDNRVESDAMMQTLLKGPWVEYVSCAEATMFSVR